MRSLLREGSSLYQVRRRRGDSNLPQLSYSCVVEEGLSVVEQDAPDSRQALAATIKRTVCAILPTAQVAGHLASTTSGVPLLLLFALAHQRASDAVASRLAFGLEGKSAAVRPPLHTIFTAATLRRELERCDHQSALKTMRTGAVARCCLRSVV